MNTKYKIFAVITPLIFIADLLTKYAIIKNVRFGERIPVIPGLFDIVHFKNTGAAFGMLASLSAGFREPFFFIVAFIAVFVLVVYLKSLDADSRLMPVAISLVLGGIAGNILDRIRFGSVVDFLSVHIGEGVLKFSFIQKNYEIPLEWPAFNVADSAITIAMFLLIYVAFFRKESL